MNFFTEFKRVCDSLRTHKSAAFWLFREFMYGPTHAAIKAWLTLFWDNVNRHDWTIATYVEVVNHLLGRYPTDAVIRKADEKTHRFKKEAR